MLADLPNISSQRTNQLDSAGNTSIHAHTIAENLVDLGINTPSSINQMVSNICANTQSLSPEALGNV